MTFQAPSEEPTLLVAEVDLDTLARVQELAASLGINVVTRQTTLAAIAAVREVRPHAVLADVTDLDGHAVLDEVAAGDPGCRVIMVTGNANVETAISAIKAGAVDYLTKPVDSERLREALITVRKSAERREILLRLDADVARQFEFCGMIGRSAVMQQLFDAIRRLAPHLRTVLVMGETGTGKELVARALHRLSPRRDKRLITVNCSAFVDTLFESELFGHVRGAFTGATDTKVGLFEHADGGTIFLDEVGELPLTLQPRLLRVVEYGELKRVGALDTRKTDVCVIAATNRDLAADVAAHKFRSDLYYRLGILELYLVALRERREDIPYLSAAFIRESAERLKKPIVGITAGGERLLQCAPWPGNIRQLRHVIERACLQTDGRLITEREIHAALSAPPSSTAAFSNPLASSPPSDDDPNRLSTAQRRQIEHALRQAGGNKSAAAVQLGISRRSLYRWIERLQIPGTRNL
jgi:DNA-binding NtrC family response regulator